MNLINNLIPNQMILFTKTPSTISLVNKIRHYQRTVNCNSWR